MMYEEVLSRLESKIEKLCIRVDRLERLLLAAEEKTEEDYGQLVMTEILGSTSQESKMNDLTFKVNSKDINWTWMTGHEVTAEMAAKEQREHGYDQRGYCFYDFKCDKSPAGYKSTWTCWTSCD